MMRKEDFLKPLKLIAMVAVVVGLVFTTSCDSDDDDCVELTWYLDNDGDGLGDAGTTTMACVQPEGYVANSDDTDDSGATETIAEIVTGDPNLSTLLSFVAADAELLAIVSGTTNHTVFAPDNNAFVKLQTTLGVESLNEVAAPLVAAVLRFHFTTGRLTLDELKQGDFYTTLEGSESSVSTDGLAQNAGTAGSAKILSSELATNGAIHVVETVLIPPALLLQIGLNLGTLAQPVLLSASFTDVNGIVQLADSNVPDGEVALAAILADPTASMTVFVPTNQVLDGVAASLSITKEVLIGSVTTTPAAARAFILNHVYTDGQLTAADVLATVNSETGIGATITMASGKELTVRVVPAVTSGDNATPTGCTNGGTSCVFLAGDVADPSTYVPIFATDVFKVQTETGELPGATNGSLHVSSIIQ